MRWLIIEDSIESRSGHWFEYLEGFCRELPKLGDEVSLLVSCRAEPFIQERLKALPCLPESVFSKMSDGASLWRRYARIPIHAWMTFLAVRKHLRAGRHPDVIFVPTVIVHHLLAWVGLIKLILKKGNARVLLFFPGLPIRQKGDVAALDGSPTSRLLRKLLRSLEPEIRAGKVILGVETSAMKQAGESVFDLPFSYFPHPAQSCIPVGSAEGQRPAEGLVMACYGSARHEKGSDLLAAAMERYLERHPDGRIRFVLQWMEGFTIPSGAKASLPEGLRQNPRVEIVSRYFADGEYARRLESTNVLLLPYRRSSYALRVSRMVVEAMVNGIPMVTTRGTTLAEQAEQFGAAHFCEDDDIESLVEAIERAERDYELLAATARQHLESARDHFSVRLFRNLATRTNLTNL